MCSRDVNKKIDQAQWLTYSSRAPPTGPFLFGEQLTQFNANVKIYLVAQIRKQFLRTKINFWILKLIGLKPDFSNNFSLSKCTSLGLQETWYSTSVMWPMIEKIEYARDFQNEFTLFNTKFFGQNFCTNLFFLKR